jgi:hypothetical protein
MLLRVAVGLGVSKLAIAGLFQVEVVSSDILQILDQSSPLVVVLVVVYYLQKVQREEIHERRIQQVEDAKETREWLEKMLEIQRVSLKETYEGQQQFVTALLAQIEKKQNDTLGLLERLRQQMEVNTSTVSEIAKVDSMFSELIARLEKK